MPETKPDRYVPHTPGGSALVHLAKPTEAAAWKALLKETTTLYHNQQQLIERGYTVEVWPG